MARLSDEEIEERLAGLEGWERDGDAIVKHVRQRATSRARWSFVNRLTPEAEEMNHHPDLEISWNDGHRHHHDALARAGSRRTTSSSRAALMRWPSLLHSPRHRMSDDDPPRSRQSKGFQPGVRRGLR